MSTTTTRLMAAGPSHNLSLPSVPCTSVKRAHPVKVKARPMRSSWTPPPSPLPLIPHQAPMPTLTMPTTRAWSGSRPRASVVNSRVLQSALLTDTRGNRSPPSCCQDLHGAFLQRGKRAQAAVAQQIFNIFPSHERSHLCALDLSILTYIYHPHTSCTPCVY